MGFSTWGIYSSESIWIWKAIACWLEQAPNTTTYRLFHGKYQRAKIKPPILLNTLSQANGIKKHAAAMLKIDARNLPYLLRKHHLGEGLQPN
jgi:hypothetical protein